MRRLIPIAAFAAACASEAGPADTDASSSSTTSGPTDPNAYCRLNNHASIGGVANFEAATVPFSADFRRKDGAWTLVMLGPPRPSACDSQ